MNNYKIRLATNQDISEILQLMADHAEFEGQPFLTIQAHNNIADISALPITLYVVEYNAQLIGYMSFIKQFSTWDMAYYLYLDCLYLCEEARGKGLGKQLMLTLKKQAKKQGLKLIQWQTPTSNQSAIHFYTSLGAKPKHKARFFWS